MAEEVSVDVEVVFSSPLEVLPQPVSASAPHRANTGERSPRRDKVRSAGTRAKPPENRSKERMWDTRSGQSPPGQATDRTRQTLCARCTPQTRSYVLGVPKSDHSIMRKLWHICELRRAGGEYEARLRAFGRIAVSSERRAKTSRVGTSPCSIGDGWARTQRKPPTFVGGFLVRVAGKRTYCKTVSMSQSTKRPCHSLTGTATRLSWMLILPVSAIVLPSNARSNMAAAIPESPVLQWPPL